MRSVSKLKTKSYLRTDIDVRRREAFTRNKRTVGDDAFEGIDDEIKAAVAYRSLILLGDFKPEPTIRNRSLEWSSWQPFVSPCSIQRNAGPAQFVPTLTALRAQVCSITVTFRAQRWRLPEESMHRRR
jgi:hypothetical protein